MPPHFAAPSDPPAAIPPVKPRPPLPGGPYLVVGLARSGVAAALALRARGEDVIGVDSGDPDGAGRLREAGVEVQVHTPGGELVDRARTLIKSPGVPAGAPAVTAARDRGLTVIGELELAWRLMPNPFIAVTGTNGKTTTTELLGHVHREAGLPHAVAGNVGTALASLVGELDPDAVVVAETSSFQLEDTEAFSPEAAVLLNVAEDHLDRHGTLDAYREAKLRAFAHQEPGDVAVAPAEFALPGAGRRIVFGAEGEMTVRDGALVWRGERLLPVDELALRGPHNLENAMAAAAVALARGVDPDAVRSGLRTFPGVPHRLEEVAERDGVLFVNDSKATNVASALVALRSFETPVLLIAGGRGKGSGFDALAPVVAEHCAAVYLIGEAAADLARALDGAGVPLHRSGDLATAVRDARAAARAGDVVLLSPACTSFDQYPDFEARGEHFRRLAAGA
jgi:UDP-N-acetylmuramoylalanine--D-glutamate ligase